MRVSIFPQSFDIFPTISSYPRSIYSTLVMSVSPRAIIPAMIIVTPARRSQLDTVVHLRCVFQNIIASCGFMIAICHFIFSTSMSQFSRHSKRTSWIREMPSACVSMSAKGDWRSVGNPGYTFVWSVVGTRLERELYTVIVSVVLSISNRTPTSRHFPRKAVRSHMRDHSIRMLGAAVSAPRTTNVPLSI